jgi:Mg2+-importing ATPase
MSWNEIPPSARDASTEAVLAAFASMPVDMVLERLQTHKDGLADFEADSRRGIKGSNVLPTHKPPSWILTLLGAIPNPFNVLLIILAIIGLAVPERDWVRFPAIRYTA